LLLLLHELLQCFQSCRGISASLQLLHGGICQVLLPLLELL
jgi:hypothetical protein